MKRILPLVLTVLLLPALLAVPVMADEVTESGWINILDYGYALGYHSNYYTLTSGSGSKSLWLQYENPSDLFLYGYDLIIKTDSTDFKIGTYYQWLTIIPLGDNYYRAYGLQNAASSVAAFGFDYTNGSYMEVLSFKASTISSIYRSLTADLTGQMYNGTYFDAVYSGSSYAAADWSGAGLGFDDRVFSSYLIITGNVQAYDFVEVNLSLNVEDIESISVDDSVSPLPFEINSIYQATANSPVHPNTIVTLRIDVRGLESGYKPIIRITGNSHVGNNRYTISYVGGILQIEAPSPLTYWFAELNLWISNQTSAITSVIATWGQNIINALGGNNDASQVTDNINSAVGELEGIQSVMDGVTRPDLNAIDFNVSGMLDTSAVAVYGNIFSTLIGNQYMTNILMIAFILAAASFLLFGRR